MKYLVTGGAGFIGSSIVRRIINENGDAVVLDDLSLGSVSNIPGVELIRGDVRDASLVERAVQGVDGIFHEAARSSSPMFYPDPRDGLDVNLRGFMNVLEAARKLDIPIVYASTSSLYSRCQPPHSENAHIKPGSFYEFSFFARERAASLYAELYGVRAVGLRYFSVYGPHEEHKGQYANNVSQFIWCMLEGRAPTIYGDGNQTRDFIYIDDVVEANFKAMHSGLRGEVLNVGTGIETTFNQLVELIGNELGVAMKPVYIPNPIKNYVFRTQAETRRCHKLLDFKASIPLTEGIKRSIDYYRSSKDLLSVAKITDKGTGCLDAFIK
ncbi:MAG: NAD-dependent epimerase/dehydratase family protein [Candidatus Methanomethylicia archaeon]|nr:NAD-dependent epimerase/dehydratase family protein [Candidatus Methanomethylicia archaeon]